jgi:hypothetical protein
MWVSLSVCVERGIKADGLHTQCADITFVERGDEDPMPDGMCQNSSTIGFNLVYTTTSDSFRTAVVIPGVLGLATLFAVLAQLLL